MPSHCSPSIRRPFSPLHTSTAMCGLLLSFLAHAQSVNRCEGPDNRVVYSNEGCPPGTRLVRTFEPTPPVVIHEGREGKPSTANRDGASKPDGKSADGKGSESGATPRGGRVERTQVKPQIRTPEESRELASERRKQKIAECDELVRRIDFAERDFAAAAAEDKATGELTVRRLQQQHAAECGPKR